MTLKRTNPADLKNGDVGIVGIPFDENSSFLKGTAKAPLKIIEAIQSDSANYFTENLIDLSDHPKVKWVGNVSYSDYLDISTPVRSILEKGAVPFSLGGDHSITFPIIQAFSQKFDTLNILHFDAHGDLYDELDGNRYSHACPFARIMEAGLARRLVQVGIRTMTRHQAEQVDRFGVEVIQMKDWSEDIRFGFDGPVYISFDMDVLDPAFAPGISHHEPGGFSTREILSIIQHLDLNIVGVDIVEYNPERDVNGVTAMVAAKIAKEILARIVDG